METQTIDKFWYFDVFLWFSLQLINIGQKTNGYNSAIWRDLKLNVMQ